MKYFLLKPDVPGYLVNPKGTLANYSNISSVHYVLECFPTDDIFKCRRIYIVKEDLAYALARSEMTGFELKSCVVSKGDQFEISSPGYKELPELLWLYIDGVAGSDDFGISDNLKLIISERALELLKGFVIENADITRI